MRSVLPIFLGTALLASTAVAADRPARNNKQNQAQVEQMSPDMREAIEFQRAKDRADARQAAKEARHPTVFYNGAERSDQGSMPGKKIPDQGATLKK